MFHGTCIATKLRKTKTTKIWNGRSVPIEIDQPFEPRTAPNGWLGMAGGFLCERITKSELAFTILKSFLTFFKMSSCLHCPPFALCNRKWNIVIARIVCFPFIYKKDIFRYVQFSQDLMPRNWIFLNFWAWGSLDQTGQGNVCISVELNDHNCQHL